MKTCYQQLELIETPSTFVIRGKSNDKTDNYLGINRSSTNFFKASANDLDQKTSSETIQAILGSIELLSGRYLVVVKESKKVATIQSHIIHKVTEVKIIPFEKKPVQTQLQQDEGRYLELLYSALNDCTFYFSYTYDATITIQQWYKTQNSRTVVGENSDEHFLWNGFLLKEFLTNFEQCQGWFVPLIRGFAETSEIPEHNSLKFTILSRLGCKRVGTRYNIRGGDIEGNVANFVETEQVIEFDNNLISFLQVRGSIPLIWAQKPNLQYKPPFTLKKEVKAFDVHFDNILDRYDSIVIVNLVNQKGSEKKLADEYENQYREYSRNQNIKYIAFDFHNKCKSMNYDAIVELTDQVEPALKAHGYFHMNTIDGKILREQKGVIRSNCIDCLDRTNVCQSVFAKIVLTEQLQSLKLLAENCKVADVTVLNNIYQNVWADNGDQMSVIYAGTGAIKADFTRTGTRTWRGLLNDGINSVTRYYLNNFKDGIKQDSVNLLLGKYVIRQNVKSPFEHENQVNVLHSILKYGFFISLFMIVANAAKVPSSDSTLQALFSVLIWVIVTFVFYKVLVMNGRKMVNNPSLKTSDDEKKKTK
ncbi:hypothetical protein ABK040_012868 [Willaertia magna]